MNHLVHLARRGVVRVAGADATTLLNGVITIDVSTIGEGASRPAALLTPQGKVLHEMHVHVGAGGAFLLDAAADAIADLTKRMKLYRLRAKADIDDVSADVAVLAGPDGARRLGASDDATSNDLAAYDAARVADGRPEQGVDYGSTQVFPTDVNLDLLGGVDYAKGCFVGQEVASRMKRRGSIRKRTLVLNVDSANPAKGADIVADGLRLGEVLSSAGGKSLALVRVDRLADAQPNTITVEEHAAHLTFPTWFPDDAQNTTESKT